MHYIIYFDIAALILFGIHWIVYLLYQQHMQSRQTKIYMWIILTGTISTVLDLTTVAAYEYAANLPMWLNYALNIIFLVSFDLVPCLYVLYTCEMIGRQRTRLVRWGASVIYVLEAVLITTSPMHKLVFYFDEDYVYSHGIGYFVIYGISLTYLVISLILTAHYRHELRLMQKMVICAYTVGNITVVMIQGTHPNYLLSEFAVAIALYFIYLTLQNPLEYLDGQTGLLNKDALCVHIGELIAKGERFSILCIRMDGTEIIRERMGLFQESRIRQNFAEYMRKNVKEGSCYSSSGELFHVLMPMRKGTEKRVEKKIRAWGEHPIVIEGVELKVSLYTACFRYPEDAAALEEMLNLMEYWATGSFSSSNMEECSEEFKEQMHYEHKLRAAIQNAIINEDFEVYYQPIYNWKAQRFTHVEALARLYDGDMGFISPDEFVTYAERTGQIVRIGDIIYNKVCQMLRTYHPEQYGMEMIHVNLSVLQCAQNNLAAEYIARMDEYGIPHDRISFEITETASAEMERSIQANLKIFREAGIELVMDDYGTGYSNLVNLYQYSYGVVKIDKSMLWGAEEDIMLRVLLENSIGTFKDLEKIVVAEGVETQAQVDLLKAFDCDLFQGYFYSKPLPEKEFIEFLQKNAKQGE